MPDRATPARARAAAHAWIVYLIGGALLALLYALVPPFEGSGPMMNLIGVTPVIAILAGVRLHRPAGRAPWLLFAAGLALFWLGDLYTYSYPKLLHHDVPFPSLGDGLYVAVYPVLMAGLLILVHRRAQRSADRSAVDAAILAIGLALPQWMSQIAPYVHDGSMDLLAKSVSVAYPLGDAILLAAAIRVALDGGRRGPSFNLMGLGIVSLLVTDFIYGLLTLHGTYHHQISLDLGWIAFYLLWGASALHPTMARLDESQPTTQSLTLPRLALLTGASLIAPVIELRHEIALNDLDYTVIVGASILLFGLVVIRMARLVRERTALTEEIARRQGEARFTSLVQHSSDLITVLGPDGTIAYQSPAIEHVLGIPAADMIGEPIDRLVDPAEATRLRAMITDGGRAANGTSEAHECTLRDAEGRVREFELLVTNLLHDEHVNGVVLNGRDVSERKAFERQLAHQAFHDPVTALPNRALFVERVRHGIARSRREGTGLAVLFMDLDDFKVINDSLGHAAGDEVLAEIAQRLVLSIRASDTAARFGGDEYAVLLEDIEGVQEAADAAERIIAAVGAPLSAGHEEVLLRASIGIAVAAETTDADAIIRDADAAMYIAKRDGKGSYRIFEPAMHEGVLARLELRRELQRALAGDQLELHYQPVIRLEDGSVKGFEALLRWNHPVRGRVAPDEFIPLAEETGLILPIGRWVLQEGCRQGAALLAALDDDRPTSLAINLSLKQLQHSDVVADVREALEASGLDARRLTLEITESVLMADTDLAVERLAELKALGVQLALDDFGTGYSSLSYLSRFPVDVLKMDRSFLRQDVSPQQAELANIVVALGTTLSLEVVAEGIEHSEQWTTLRALGCDLGQGFYFARPMSAQDTHAFLAEHVPAADAP